MISNILKSKIKNLEKKLGINFKNKKLVLEAITHKSYINENKNLNFSHNERLEFLGDAVLELLITEELYKKFRDFTEGELTNIRSQLVNTDLLFKVGKKLELGKEVLLSKGEKKLFNKGEKTIIADCVEAIIGAIYLDKGYKQAKQFIKKFILIHLPEILEGEILDPKTNLQELIQAHIKITPCYKILKEWGPSHDKKFEVGVFIENEMIGKGVGSSKKQAEQEAAKQGLKKIKKSGIIKIENM